MESSHTLAVKGSRDVKLKKSSTSHKRCTYTPVVNAEGKVLISHVLLSKLKKIPRDVHEKQSWCECNRHVEWNHYCAIHQWTYPYQSSNAISSWNSSSYHWFFGAQLKMDKKFEDKEGIHCVRPWEHDCNNSALGCIYQEALPAILWRQIQYLDGRSHWQSIPTY